MTVSLRMEERRCLPGGGDEDCVCDCDKTCDPIDKYLTHYRYKAQASQNFEISRRDFEDAQDCPREGTVCEDNGGTLPQFHCPQCKTTDARGGGEEESQKPTVKVERVGGDLPPTIHDVSSKEHLQEYLQELRPGIDLREWVDLVSKFEWDDLEEILPNTLRSLKEVSKRQNAKAFRLILANVAAEIKVISAALEVMDEGKAEWSAKLERWEWERSYCDKSREARTVLWAWTMLAVHALHLVKRWEIHDGLVRGIAIHHTLTVCVGYHLKRGTDPATIWLNFEIE